MSADALTGRRVGVTAARKAEEQIAALHRRGAEVVHAPAVEYVDLADDPQLREQTRFAIESGAATVVVTTGMGLRGWLAAAEGWGMGGAVRGLLRSSRLVVRGQKAAGAVREAGLREDYTPGSETDAELLEYLLSGEVAGRHVVLQSHGEALPAFTGPLVAAGARVTELLPYRWRVPGDTAPIRELLAEAGAGRLDAVTFTSTPAVHAVLRVGGQAAVAEALRCTLVACVGSVTSAPLVELGVRCLLPERARTGAMLRLLEQRFS